MKTLYPPLTRAQVHNAYAHGFLDDYSFNRELTRLDAADKAACDSMTPLLCASGRHPWHDPEDRRRCCAGYRRVFGTSREDLEGCEHVRFVPEVGYLGWERLDPESEATHAK